MLHEALQISRLAKTLQASAEAKTQATDRVDAMWRDQKERVQVLKLRWMGLHEETDALESKFGHSFATKLGARYQTA